MNSVLGNSGSVSVLTEVTELELKDREHLHLQMKQSKKKKLQISSREAGNTCTDSDLQVPLVNNHPKSNKFRSMHKS
jgi:hypothetical protein